MILNKGVGPEKSCALSAARAGSYMVEEVSGPENQRLRLHEMGINTGTRVSLLACSGEGMFVVKIGGSRLALTRGTADHIWVSRNGV